MSDIDMLSRRVPVICKLRRTRRCTIFRTSTAPAGILSILGELNRGKLLDTAVVRVDGNDARRGDPPERPAQSGRCRRGEDACAGRPGERFNLKLGSQDTIPGGRYRPREGMYPRPGASVPEGRRTGRTVRQHRPQRLHRQDGGRRRVDPAFRGQSPRIRIAGRGLRRYSGR